MCKNPPSPKTLIYIIFYDIDAYTNSILSMPYISGLVLVVSATAFSISLMFWPRRRTWQSTSPRLRDRRAGWCVDKQEELMSYTGGVKIPSGGFKHQFYFPFHIWDVILSIDEVIFFKMVETTNQWFMMIYAHGAWSRGKHTVIWLIRGGWRRVWEFVNILSNVDRAAGIVLLWVWFLCNHQNIWR